MTHPEPTPFTVVDRIERPNGRTSVDIKCPFCRSVTTAFVWSLAGSGKRCENENCRAMFGSLGFAYRAEDWAAWGRTK